MICCFWLQRTSEFASNSRILFAWKLMKFALAMMLTACAALRDLKGEGEMVSAKSEAKMPKVTDPPRSTGGTWPCVDQPEYREILNLFCAGSKDFKGVFSSRNDFWMFWDDFNPWCSSQWLNLFDRWFAQRLRDGLYPLVKNCLYGIATNSARCMKAAFTEAHGPEKIADVNIFYGHIGETDVGYAGHEDCKLTLGWEVQDRDDKKWKALNIDFLVYKKWRVLCCCWDQFTLFHLRWKRWWRKRAE